MPLPQSGAAYLKEIGKLPLINNYADPMLDISGIAREGASSQTNKTFGEYRQRLMRPVDIFPVKFELDLPNLMATLFSSSDECHVNNLPVNVNFLRGIIDYNLKLSAIDLCQKTVVGLRIWVNNETQSTDAIQNNYKENKIAETYNNQIDNASQASEYLRSAGIITDPAGAASLNPFAAALLDSRHVSLPKIWEKTDYNPQLDLTVKLISPYGNIESFKKYIAYPLLYLTALTAPSTYDGVTYGQPTNMYVRAYGVTFIPLAYADSFSIIRGGTNARVNWNKQPLELSVSMSFKPAMPGFAAFMPGSSPTIINNAITNLLTGGNNGTCIGLSGCKDPIGRIDQLNASDLSADVDQIIANQGILKIPGVTSLGHIIQSLRPVDEAVRTTPPTLLNNRASGYDPINSTNQSATTTPQQNPIPTQITPQFTQRQPTFDINALFNTTSQYLSTSGIGISADELRNLITGL